MSNARVLALVGSLRNGAVTRQLAETAHRVSPEGAEVVVYDGLAQVPFYNPDLDTPEAPIAPVVALREAAAGADALLLVTPEYNGTIPAVLKNAIDWISRPYGSGAAVGKPVDTVDSAAECVAAEREGEGALEPDRFDVFAVEPRVVQP